MSRYPLGVGGGRLHEWAFATRSFRRAHGMLLLAIAGTVVAVVLR